MRYSEDHKAKTHQRIIDEAALRFRRDGIGATGLQPLMKALEADEKLGLSGAIQAQTQGTAQGASVNQLMASMNSTAAFSGAQVRLSPLNIEEQFCPTNPDGNKFMIVKNYQNPLIVNYEKFLKANHIEVAGIEYMLDKQGNAYTYDVNTNTNYNSVAEKKAGQFGMLRIAEFLKAELKKL